MERFVSSSSIRALVALWLNCKSDNLVSNVSMIGSLGGSIDEVFVSLVAMEDVFVEVVAVDENDTFFQACF